ncbi:1-phosphatidylinositol 4,5-bisphosphate phosphodiesterase beta-1-like [Artemia franciscana]|uniref:Phosphoinositide phospholipase C n=1 Tax=Artemia franciscana TaxID=6661 RepID=A0AA88LC41_ARTSF|nr:hypothetical protein QYM36_010496 [Artemia franciscana]
MQERADISNLEPVSVNPSFVKGEEIFYFWDKHSSAVIRGTLKVDKDGFFLYWVADKISGLAPCSDKILDISIIRDTRTGLYAKTPKDRRLRDRANFGSSHSLEDKTVTICYGTDLVKVQFLSFICSSKDVAKIWCDELLKVAYNLRALHGSVEMFLRKEHTRLCFIHRNNQSGYMPVSFLVNNFASHEEDKRKVEQALESARVSMFFLDKEKVIDLKGFTCDHFYQFYHKLTVCPEVFFQIFPQICKEKKQYLTSDELVDFLNKVQRDPRLDEILYPYANKQNALHIIRQYEPFMKPRALLSYEGFLRYLISEECIPVRLDKLDLCDMTKPLAHYFISSSHNTYLTGDQFSSKSSSEMYRQALLSGCRCVELDFWDGKHINKPIVVHGHTRVKEILAKDAIDAIAESAFKISEYPVILSFENHCSKSNQAKIAKYCRQSFGGMLLDGAIDGYPLEPGSPLPSPSLLKRKIIIKNKKKADIVTKPDIIDESEESGDDDVMEQAPSDPKTEEYSIKTMQLPQRTMKKKKKKKGTAGNGTEAGAEISALVNYIQPVCFHSFEQAESQAKSFEMSSFTEGKAEGLLKKKLVEFRSYNKRQLSRVYPNAFRVNSSNFMPHRFWDAGVQMVALNYQTLDIPMQLNLALFELNNRCGYLLKSDIIKSDSDYQFLNSCQVSIKVISGQLLSDKRIGTFVEVEMYGAPVDYKYRTETVPLNGINPWYDQSFSFVFNPSFCKDLACLRLAVYEEPRRFIGHRVLPINLISPGYKYVTLRNELGQPLGLKSIFVYIKVTKWDDIFGALIE